MKWNIYTVYDSCAGIYQRPFVAHSDGEAVRSFGDIANDKEHPIGHHPEHYSLFRLGTFSDQDASINTEAKECLASAHEIISQPPLPLEDRET